MCNPLAIEGTLSRRSSRAEARSDAPSPAVAARSASPERRQLTIMVCTMVVSRPLSGDLDPEEMSERIAPFHKVVADVVARFDGFVAQYLGDGVHVYFGYPAAHEHDAEQAVRAGLALLDAVGTLETVFRRDPSSARRHRHRAGCGRRAAGDRQHTTAYCDRRRAKPGGAAAGRGSAR